MCPVEFRQEGSPEEAENSHRYRVPWSFAVATKEVTAGQYREFRPNDVLRLKKNADYWQKGLPYLDEVIFRVVPDINTRATMLQAASSARLKAKLSKCCTN